VTNACCLTADDGPKDEKKQENDNDREKKNDENRQNDEKPHNDGPKKSPYDMWAERQRGTTESTEGGPSNQMKWVMGIAGVAAFIGVLYYISREPAAEITFQAFISELLARDLVRHKQLSIFTCLSSLICFALLLRWTRSRS
jgi:hypothetical protein